MRYSQPRAGHLTVFEVERDDEHGEPKAVSVSIFWAWREDGHLGALFVSCPSSFLTKSELDYVEQVIKRQAVPTQGSSKQELLS